MSRVLGIDVSKWQGQMDWAQACEAGARFAFLRAGSIDAVYAQCYEDYQWARNSVIAPRFMPCGCYWYFRPNLNPAKQANFYLELVRGKDFKLPLVADVEEAGGLNSTQVALNLALFIETIHALTGKYPLIYTRGEWWNSHVADSPLWDKCGLWIARYHPSLSGPWADGKYKPRDWSEWRFWQFSADGNNRGHEFGAESDDICLDYFNGAEADFRAYLGEAPQPLTREQKIDRLLAYAEGQGWI